jgi:hypothetical protein
MKKHDSDIYLSITLVTLGREVVGWRCLGFNGGGGDIVVCGVGGGE